MRKPDWPILQMPDGQRMKGKADKPKTAKDRAPLCPICKTRHFGIKHDFSKTKDKA